MPHATFMRLPDEKQRSILAAAKEEFSLHPFEKASVSGIVRRAGISHGSFYQYFEGKEDLLQYLLRGYRERLIELAATCLRKQEGDLFAAFSGILHTLVDTALRKENSGFLRNLLGDMRINTEFYLRLPDGEVRETLYQRFSPYPEQMFTRWGRPETEAMLAILLSVSRTALYEILVGNFPAETVFARYERQLILLRGAMKQQTHGKGYDIDVC